MVVVFSMYVTLMPVILAGILTMIWCKLPVVQAWARPMDRGRQLKDGRRLFGENKTWKGFAGYLLMGTFSGITWGVVCQLVPALGRSNYLYAYHDNSVTYNALMGLAFGLAYTVCELPNSFLKRRVGIQPGKPSAGSKRWLFFLLDQVDSLLGCVFVLCLVYPMSVGFYCLFVLLGGLTHIAVNLVLYALKLRKNIF